MQFRRLEAFATLVAGGVGAAMPVATLSGDGGRLLVTFLGLFSASILPTISLMLGSMTASGRSVSSLNSLRDELADAMDALLFLFGLVALAVLMLTALAINAPPLLEQVPHLTMAMHRIGEGGVAATATLLIFRSGQIPGILRRSLAVRYDIAVEEARRKMEDAAPKPGDIRERFKTHPDFGKVTKLADLGGRE